MQLTLKTLTKKVFTIELDSEKSVEDLKFKIEKEHGSDFPANRLKLILKGKVLENDQIISSLSYVDKSFILLMVIKEPQHMNKSKPIEKKDKSLADVTNQETQNLSTDISQIPVDITTKQVASEEMDDDEDDSDSEENPLSTVELLIKFPEDQDIGELVEKFQERLNEDPNLLQRMIEDAGFDPEMFSMDTNEDDYTDDESESDDEVDDSEFPMLSQEDIENVDSITAMGFNEEKALEAYLACGRNVESAINFLLSNTE